MRREHCATQPVFVSRLSAKPSSQHFLSHKVGATRDPALGGLGQRLLELVLGGFDSAQCAWFPV